MSRIFLPEAGIDPDFLDSLTESLISGEPVHVYVQLIRHLDEEERAVFISAMAKAMADFDKSWFQALKGKQNA